MTWLFAAIIVAAACSCGGDSSENPEPLGCTPGDLLAGRFNGNRSFVGHLSIYLGYLNIDPIYPDKLIRLGLSQTSAVPRLI